MTAAVIGLVGSIALVTAVRAWGRRGALLDAPNHRSLHVVPTPRGGGIGIVLPVCSVLIWLGWLMPEFRRPATCLVAGGLLTAMVGLIDDLRGLPVALRLTAYAIAAGAVVIGLGAWHTVTWPGLVSFDLGWAGVPMTFLLIVGFTNAYNFMDGIDGIAGCQGFCAGLGWWWAGLAVGDPFLEASGAVIALSSLGFLVFNWAPASIFMGDVGSAFMGFLLASLIVYSSSRHPSLAIPGLLFVWPFVFDATFTFLRRAVRRENLLVAHRSHLYQRLVLAGYSHRAVALLYGALAAIGVVCGQIVSRGERLASVQAVMFIGALAVLHWLAVLWRERTVVRTGG